jgi:hypothetical protein
LYFDAHGKPYYLVLGGVCVGITAGFFWNVAGKPLTSVLLNIQIPKLKGFTANAYQQSSGAGQLPTSIHALLTPKSSNASSDMIGGIVALGINLHTTGECVPHSV